MTHEMPTGMPGVTLALCGEHGYPLAHGKGWIRCAGGCDLVWSDFQEEIGSVVEAHEGWIYVIDLEEASILGEARGYEHAAYALAYYSSTSDADTLQADGLRLMPARFLSHFSDAVRTSWEQGWERGVAQAIEDDAALDGEA